MSFSAVFAPETTVSVVASSSESENVDISGSDSNFTARLFNSGSNTVFVAFGSSTVAATLSDMPVPGGLVEVVHTEFTITHCGVITTSGSATLYITNGSAG